VKVGGRDWSWLSARSKNSSRPSRRSWSGSSVRALLAARSTTSDARPPSPFPSDSIGPDLPHLPAQMRAREGAPERCHCISRLLAATVAIVREGVIIEEEFSLVR
jgi:hypothetical protein